MDMQPNDPVVTPSLETAQNENNHGNQSDNGHGNASVKVDGTVEESAQEERSPKRLKVDATHPSDDAAPPMKTTTEESPEIQAEDAQDEPSPKRLKVDDVATPAMETTREESPAVQAQEAESPEQSTNKTEGETNNVEVKTSALNDHEAHEQLKATRLAFIAQLKPDDNLDAKCYAYRRWYAGKVVYINEKFVKVHFHGFKSSQDVVYEANDYTHLAPAGTFAKPFIKRGRSYIPEPSAVDADLGGVEENPVPAKLPAKRKYTAKPKPRKPKVKREFPPAVPPPPTDPPVDIVKEPKPAKAPKAPRPPKPAKIEEPVDLLKKYSIQEADFPLWAASTNTLKPKGNFAGDLEREQEVCLACFEVEDEDQSEYVLCDGGCLGSFHQSCVGITSMDQLGETWLCEDCTRKEHTCFLCGKHGVVGEDVMKCSFEDCGKFYHPECVLLDPRSQVTAEKKTVGCPRHVCKTCLEPKGQDGLMKCLYCPNAFHPRCVPPSAHYNNSALICGKHEGKKLPSIPDFFGPNAICFDGKFKFPILFLPKQPVPFRLPKYLVSESDSKPPRYTKLRRNLYLFKPKKLDLEDLPICQCTGDVCDDECTNRVSFVECIGGTSTGTKKEKYFNCRVGANCGNRALQEMKLPKTQIFKTSNGRGFGLKVLEPVKQGSLVIEYVGEVLTPEMKYQRLIEHAEKNPHDPNYYIMQLDKNSYLDGRIKGSDSRFINHSCDPNCHLLKWEVGEYKRIAITALRDIEAGEELSYDYQMETTSTESFKCHCGAPKCRGTMAPDNLNWEAHAKMKKAEDAAKKVDKKSKKKRKRVVKSDLSAAPSPDGTVPCEANDSNITNSEDDETTASSAPSPEDASSPSVTSPIEKSAEVNSASTSVPTDVVSTISGQEVKSVSNDEQNPALESTESTQTSASANDVVCAPVVLMASPVTSVESEASGQAQPAEIAPTSSNAPAVSSPAIDANVNDQTPTEAQSSQVDLQVQ